MKAYVRRLTDSRGNKRDVGALHDEETVCVGDLRDLKGKKVSFESKLYHLESWAEEHGIQVASFEVDVDVDRSVAKMKRVV